MYGFFRYNGDKMKKVWLAAIVLCLILAGSFYWGGERGITNYPSQNSGIVAFGDSLVEGVGSTQGGWVSLVATNLRSPITNLGRSGDTTAAALSRISVVTQRKPAITIVLLGGNDFIQRVPREKTFSNLEKIITAIQASGSAVVLVGLDAGLLAQNEAELFENLSVKYRTAYVPDILDDIYGKSSLMADPLHPNDAGYRIMAERIGEGLSKLLKN